MLAFFVHFIVCPVHAFAAVQWIKHSYVCTYACRFSCVKKNMTPPTVCWLGRSIVQGNKKPMIKLFGCVFGSPQPASAIAQAGQLSNKSCKPNSQLLKTYVSVSISALQPLATAPQPTLWQTGNCVTRREPGKTKSS